MDTVFAELVILAWPSPLHKPQLEALSSLILREGTASEAVLERILACTPRLKHLVYDQYRMVRLRGSRYYDFQPCPYTLHPSYEKLCRDYKDDRERRVYIHCARIDRALRHVQHSLTSLVLKASFQADSFLRTGTSGAGLLS